MLISSTSGCATLSNHPTLTVTFSLPEDFVEFFFTEAAKEQTGEKGDQKGKDKGEDDWNDLPFKLQLMTAAAFYAVLAAAIELLLTFLHKLNMWRVQSNARARERQDKQLKIDKEVIQNTLNGAQLHKLLLLFLSLRAMRHCAQKKKEKEKK